MPRSVHIAEPPDQVFHVQDFGPDLGYKTLALFLSERGVPSPDGPMRER
jgi:hypothetical protein